MGFKLVLQHTTVHHENRPRKLCESKSYRKALADCRREFKRQEKAGMIPFGEGDLRKRRARGEIIPKVTQREVARKMQLGSGVFGKKRPQVSA